MIKKVLICGLGAVGSTYANKIINEDIELKILVDQNRLERYKNNPIIFNGEKMDLEYILPNSTDYKADLIIITTKFDGLQDAIKNIKNFISENTIILSLLNGVTSEIHIAREYGWEKVLLSYFIGHSAVRTGRSVTQDGVGKIVFGAKTNSQLHKVQLVKEFFDKCKIDYEIPEDMEYALWLKFMFNVSANQPSAILNMTFGEMQANPKFMELSKKLMFEVQAIAKAEGVKNTEKMIDDALKGFEKMTPEGQASTLQDVLAKRKTEVDIFAGAIIELGAKHNIPVPYNTFMYEMIKAIEANY